VASRIGKGFSPSPTRRDDGLDEFRIDVQLSRRDCERPCALFLFFVSLSLSPVI